MAPELPNDTAVQRPGSERKRGLGSLQRRVGRHLPTDKIALVPSDVVLDRLSGPSAPDLAGVAVYDVGRVSSECVPDVACSKVALRRIEERPTPVLLDRVLIDYDQIGWVAGIADLDDRANSATTRARASSLLSMLPVRPTSIRQRRTQARVRAVGCGRVPEMLVV